MRFFGKSTKAPPTSIDPLDGPLINFSPKDAFTIRDAFEGVQIFGGIGSGKTTGSGALLAKSFLSQGFGGLVLTAKPDEADRWHNLLHSCQRTNDVVTVDRSAQHRFNFMDYEAIHANQGLSLTENLVQLFLTIASLNASKSTGKDNEAFWHNETAKLIRNGLDLLRFADFHLSLPNLHEVITTAPQDLAQLQDSTWQAGSLTYKALKSALERHDNYIFDTTQTHDFELTYHYWTNEWPSMAQRTRSSVLSMFTGLADALLRGLMYDLFNSSTTFTPEDCFDGKVIIIDLPQKLFNETGVLAQVLFKHCWQRAVERRKIVRDSRPVFLWIDEAQHFITEHDVSFQTTARSARVATVLLTQNLPNYLMALGGERAKAMVDSLLGNLATKIFHNNTCTATNQYAADLISRDWTSQASRSASFNKGEASYSTSEQPALQYRVIPRDFTTLAKGGPAANFQTEAIVHQGGKVFAASGLNALLTQFAQSP